jgi:hypothetical protein
VSIAAIVPFRDAAVDDEAVGDVRHSKLGRVFRFAGYLRHAIDAAHFFPM